GDAPSLHAKRMSAASAAPVIVAKARPCTMITVSPSSRGGPAWRGGHGDAGTLSTARARGPASVVARLDDERDARLSAPADRDPTTCTRCIELSWTENGVTRRYFQAPA